MKFEEGLIRKQRTKNENEINYEKNKSQSHFPLNAETLAEKEKVELRNLNPQPNLSNNSEYKNNVTKKISENLINFKKNENSENYFKESNIIEIIL